MHVNGAPVEAQPSSNLRPAPPLSATAAPRPGCGRRRVIRGSAFVLLAVWLAGCATRTVTSAWQPNAKLPAPGASVAVVPFENLSSSRNAGLILTDLATSWLYADRAFKVVEISGLADDKDHVLRRMEIAPWEHQVGLNTTTAAQVGKALQTDYVLVGSVGEYGFVDGFGETATVGINLRLLRVEEEAVVWAGALSRRAACTAFSQESVHRLAHEVLKELLGQMTRTMEEQRRTESRAGK
jgi:TolB-like protein